MNNEIRWKQRFQNFEKTCELFQRRIDEYDSHVDEEVYQMALVQSFEIVQEMSWKVLKDFLENEGHDDISNSKKTFKTAFQEELITNDSEIWMNSLKMRNATTHTYDKNNLKEVLHFIRNQFYDAVRDIYHRLKKEL